MEEVTVGSDAAITSIETIDSQMISEEETTCLSTESTKTPMNSEVVESVDTPTNSEVTKPDDTPTNSEVTKPGDTPTNSEVTKPGDTPTNSEVTKPGDTPTNSEVTKPGDTKLGPAVSPEVDVVQPSAEEVTPDDFIVPQSGNPTPEVEESCFDSPTASSDGQKNRRICAEVVNGETNDESTSTIISVPKESVSPACSVTEGSIVQKDGGTPCEAVNSEANSESTLSAAIPNSETETGQVSMEYEPNSKENYRTIEGSSDSESDSDDSSSVRSLSSVSVVGNDRGNIADSDVDGDDNTSPKVQQKKETYTAVKVKGEMQPEDLPPLEELHITVPSSLCAEIGVVTSIVNTLVVIQAHKGVPALNLDSVLFADKGSRALGLVFDVFGPVNEPLYCVRFNSVKHVKEFHVEAGDKVYYAPHTEHSKYIFLKQLMEMRGSDASWRNDIEPTVQVDFSDDEEERKAKKHDSSASVEPMEDQPKRKRDQMEDYSGNKKERMPQQRNAQGKQRGGMTRTGHFTPRPFYQAPKSQHPNPGHIRPSSLTAPDFRTPPPAPRPPLPVQSPGVPDRGNATYNYPPPVAQSPYNSQPYRHPVQPVQPTSTFGQLPYGPAQTQLDPRLVRFGTQFAQMMCALQSSPTGYTSNVPSPSPPSFNLPYSQSAGYPGNQSGYNSFSNPPPQNQQRYPVFSAPPPMAPTGPYRNLPPTNIPPPFGGSRGRPPSHNFPPNQNSSYDQYPSTHFSGFRDNR